MNAHVARFRPAALAGLLALALLARAGAEPPAPTTRPADSSGDATAPAVRVRPVHIYERRDRELGRTNIPFVVSSPVEVTLRAEGREANEANAYGQIEVTEATDDTGADLKPVRKAPKTPPAADAGAGANGKKKNKGDDADDDDDSDVAANNFEFQFITRYNAEGEPDPNPETLVEVGLNGTSRRATKITRLRGEFSLLIGGRKKVVIVRRLQDLLGKSVEDQALKDAGLEVRLPNDDEDVGPGKSFLKVEVVGKPLDQLAVPVIEVLDRGGAKITNADSYDRNDPTRANFTFDLVRPLDNTLMLKIHLIVGQKLIRVPFDLKDIELP